MSSPPSISSPTPDDRHDSIPNVPPSPKLALPILNDPTSTTTPTLQASTSSDPLSLSTAGAIPNPKVTIRLQPIGSAPALKQRVFKIGSTQPFSTVVAFLQKKLSGAGDNNKAGVEGGGSGSGHGSGEGVFCYVNSVFAPGLEDVVGDLWRVSLCARGVACVGVFEIEVANVMCCW